MGVASSLALPAADPQLLLAAKPYINTGSAKGPVHAAFGDLVSTANGLHSLALEGFSEDVDQDGFVDPIGQAVVVAPAVAPVSYTVPKISVAAPAVTYTVPVAAAAVADKDAVVPAATAPLIYTGAHVAPVISYTGLEAKYASEPVVGKVQYLPGFVPFNGVPFVGGVAPAVAPAVEAVEAAAPVDAAEEGVEAV